MSPTDIFCVTKQVEVEDGVHNVHDTSGQAADVSGRWWSHGGGAPELLQPSAASSLQSPSRRKYDTGARADMQSIKELSPLQKEEVDVKVVSPVIY